MSDDRHRGPRSPADNSHFRYDARVGNRLPGDHITVTLRAIPAIDKALPDSHELIDGIVADISVSGVGVMASRNEALGIGTSVIVEICGIEGRAVVRRINDIEQFDSLAYYGLEHQHLSEGLYVLICDLAAGARNKYDWQGFSAER